MAPPAEWALEATAPAAEWTEVGTALLTAVSAEPTALSTGSKKLRLSMRDDTLGKLGRVDFRSIWPRVDVLTVNRLALSMYPGFLPAKTHKRARTKATNRARKTQRILARRWVCLL